MSVAQIRKRLESILEYMQPHWDFVNCHMVNYLTDSHWSTHIPEQLRDELPDVRQVQRCIETLYWQRNNNNNGIEFPAHAKFLRMSEAQRLRNFPELLTSVTELKQQVLGSKTINEPVVIKEFLSAKKRHEVEATAELVDELIRSHLDQTNEDVFVIDAGDGKGYLSSRLALQYDYKTLGIDANETNTENALKRNQKLKTAWSGLVERAKLESVGIVPPRHGKKRNNNKSTRATKTIANGQNYFTYSAFITSELDISHMITQCFPRCSLPRAFCLTGLHTCGNLGPTCLRLFHTQSQCKLLCNVACCYHLLKERFSTQEFFGNKEIVEAQTQHGFPMSEFLQQREVKIGRNARMLAAQSIERTLASEELPNVSLFYRALLEVLICEEDAGLKDTVRVGKLRKFETFDDYLHMCVEKTSLSAENLTFEKINALQAKFKDDKHYLDLFYLLRMSFAPILESLILLDRILFLKELGYEQSYLVPLFDPVISPRCFAIVALK